MFFLLELSFFRCTCPVLVYKILNKLCPESQGKCSNLDRLYPVAPPGIFIGGGGQKVPGSGAQPQKFLFDHAL